MDKRRPERCEIKAGGIAINGGFDLLVHGVHQTDLQNLGLPIHNTISDQPKHMCKLI